MAICAPGNQACSWIASQVDVLNNIASNMDSVSRLISGAAYLLGLMFMLKALMTLKELGEARTMMSNKGNIKEPLIYFLVSGVLIYIPTAFKMIMNSTFGYSNVLAYAPMNSNNSTLDALFGQHSAVGASLARIIQTIGLIAFIRGWILVARSASQGQAPGSMGKGMMHVLGGVLAMNIVGTLHMINNTLYGG